MEPQNPPSRRRFFWVGVAVLAIVVIAFFVSSPRLIYRNRFVVYVGTNGTPELLGISLTSTNARDHAFRALGAFRLKVAVVATKEAPLSSVAKVTQSLDRAGVVWRQ